MLFRLGVRAIYDRYLALFPTQGRSGVDALERFTASEMAVRPTTHRKPSLGFGTASLAATPAEVCKIRGNAIAGTKPRVVPHIIQTENYGIRL